MLIVPGLPGPVLLGTSHAKMRAARGLP